MARVPASDRVGVDFVDARRIVNESDRNQEIANYANNYYAALQQCRAIAQIYPKLCPKPT
jgi:hypothetical protein